MMGMIGCPEGGTRKGRPTMTFTNCLPSTVQVQLPLQTQVPRINGIGGEKMLTRRGASLGGYEACPRRILGKTPPADSKIVA
jgi:hypothetical protein